MVRKMTSIAYFIRYEFSKIMGSVVFLRNLCFFKIKVSEIFCMSFSSLLQGTAIVGPWTVSNKSYEESPIRVDFDF